MKNLTIISNFRLLLVFLFSVSFLSVKAGDIKIKPGDPELKIVQNTYSKLQLSSSFTQLTYRNVKTENGMFMELSVPEYGTSNRIGDPKLPELRKLIEIPVGATPVINIISYSVSEYKLSDYGIQYKIIPSQPPVSKDPKKKLPDFEYNKVTYNADKFNTDNLVSVDILGMMRGVRFARLNISPVRYNPVTNTVQVYNDIEVEVTFPGADIAQTTEMKKKTYSLYFESMFNNALLNYKKTLAVKDTMTKYPVKYVIVSDSSFQSALQPFIQWKTKKGFKVVEAYNNNPLVGTTTTSIKNYLQGLYNNGTPSDPAPTFVLFVGDVAQIPAFNGNAGTHVTDLYYCEYTGDYFPEVYYGRFSATNLAQLQPQIDKTLEYEQYLMPSTSFLDTVVMIAGQDPTNGPLYGDGQINYGTDTYFNSAHGLTSHTYLFAVSGTSVAQIIQDVSHGVCYANYTAHGSPSGWANPAFSISDIAGLHNAHKYPLMVGNCCQTSTYDQDCFGEELLRANNKGAIGYIGGSNSTYWDEDYWWGVGYKTVVVNPVYNANSLGSYDRTFHDHGEPIGEWYASQDQMVFAGNLAVTQSGSTSYDYYWEIYCLMGDPSLMIYYGVPSALTATYSPLVPLGLTSFTVNTEPYAYAAISMNGVLHGAALADASGIAIIPTDTISTSGVADVVVTKQNKAPFISTVIVDSLSGPYIAYSSKLLHDVAGNNNGQADYGEDITLDITLQNLGLDTAFGVSAKLRTNDPYVTLTDTVQSWGDIANGISSTQNNAYAFTVDELIPDQHPALFSLVITDNNSNTWTGTFNVVLKSPVLSIGTVTIDDASGNNNGRLDPGETVNLIFSSANTGHANAISTSSNLALNSGSVTINNGTDALGTLNALSSANATFNISVSTLAVIGSFASFTNTLTSGLYSVQKPISLMIGLVDEDWETGDFNKFLWVQGGTLPWVITNVDPYEGIYSAKSGAITNAQNSNLSVALNVLISDTISFYYKISSEQDWDFLKFYIDGIETGKWSGNIGIWTRVAFPVSAGQHTFMWSYKKDFSNLDGSDCAWIDYILFPPIQPVGISEIIVNENSLNCYPNPFNHSASIQYNLEKESKVSLKVYNTMGQQVSALVDDENKQAGAHYVNFNAENLRSGIYHCIFTADNKTIVKKLMISK